MNSDAFWAELLLTLLMIQHIAMHFYIARSVSISVVYLN